MTAVPVPDETLTGLFRTPRGSSAEMAYRAGTNDYNTLNACMTEELSEDQLRLLGGQECWGVTPSDPMGTTVRRIGRGQGGNGRERIRERTLVPAGRTSGY